MSSPNLQTLKIKFDELVSSENYFFAEAYSAEESQFALYINKEQKILELALDEDEFAPPMIEESEGHSPMGISCGPDEKDLPYTFQRAVVRAVANHFEGSQHSAIVWALMNPEKVPDGWVAPSKVMTDEEEKSVIKGITKARLEELRLRKEVRDFLAVHPEMSSYREVTFTGSDGHDHGYTNHDLIGMTVSGYSVNCWGSYAFGGNCNCNSHDPGEDFDRVLDREDFDKIKKIAEVNYLSHKEHEEVNYDLPKIRRRIEDHLRKNEGSITPIAIYLGVKLD